ncbi:hypothetical protein ACP70R_002457 [Stipagrostis hirtigluma subsp. patula]
MNVIYHPKDRVKHRFSAHRFKKVVDSLSEDQRQFVINNGFGSLLNISDFSVPVPFLEWLMDHLIVGSAEFRYSSKSFKFTRYMVQQILGIPSGNVAVDLHNTPEEFSDQVNSVRSSYIVGEKPTINEAICQTLEDHNEASFMRSFMLVAISCVICPSTQNSVNLRYLNCLMSPAEIRNYDWASHAMQYVLSEVKKYHGAIDSISNEYEDNSRYYGSCLPMLAIAYMDFLNLDNDFGVANNISYDVPRICNVKSSDFSFLMEVDLNRRSSDRRQSFGAISFRNINLTPYNPPAIEPPAPEDAAPENVQPIVPPASEDAEPEHLPQFEQPAPEDAGQDYLAHQVDPASAGVAQNFVENSTEIGVVHASSPPASDVEGSFCFNDSFQVCPTILPIVSKHCALLVKEVSQNVPDKSLVLKGMGSVFAKRLSLMSTEILGYVLSQNDKIPNDGASDVRSSLNNVLDAEKSIALQSDGMIDNTIESFPVQSDGNCEDTINGVPTCDVTNDINKSFSVAHLSPINCEDVSAAEEIPLTPVPSCNAVDDVSNGNSEIPLTPVPSCNAVDDVSNGINIALSIAPTSPITFDNPSPSKDVNQKNQLGSSTIDKKKRRRRAAISFDDEDSVQLQKLDRDVEDLYIKYVRVQYIRPNFYPKSPTFVVINGFHSNYERFRDSLKPRGHVYDDVMALFVQMFNDEIKDSNDSDSVNSRSKIAFSPFLTEKLINSTKEFAPESVEGELTRINAALNMKNADLLMFPMCLNNHWVVIVINYLNKKINFLDSMQALSPTLRERYITNLAVNLQRSCEFANIFKRDLNRYERIFTPVPRQTNTFDCGIYCMLFMMLFDGKQVKKFDKAVADQYRKIIAYKLIKSPANEIDVTKFDEAT